MTKIRITKKFNFEMAHALHGHDGLCRHIHGHSYVLEVCVAGIPQTSEGPKKGMVLDFGELKKVVKESIVDPLDHALVLSHESQPETLRQGRELFNKLVVVDYQPTSENMLIDFAARIQLLLPRQVELHSLRLFETATSYAEWFAADNA